MDKALVIISWFVLKEEIVTHVIGKIDIITITNKNRYIVVLRNTAPGVFLTNSFVLMTTTPQLFRFKNKLINTYNQ